MNHTRISAAGKQTGHWYTPPNTVAKCTECGRAAAAITSPRVLCVQCALDTMKKELA